MSKINRGISEITTVILLSIIAITSFIIASRIGNQTQELRSRAESYTASPSLFPSSSSDALFYISDSKNCNAQDACPWGDTHCLKKNRDYTDLSGATYCCAGSDSHYSYLHFDQGRCVLPSPTLVPSPTLKPSPSATLKPSPSPSPANCVDKAITNNNFCATANYCPDGFTKLTGYYCSNNGACCKPNPIPSSGDTCTGPNSSNVCHNGTCSPGYSSTSGSCGIFPLVCCKPDSLPSSGDTCTGPNSSNVCHNGTCSPGYSSTSGSCGIFPLVCCKPDSLPVPDVSPYCSFVKTIECSIFGGCVPNDIGGVCKNNIISSPIPSPIINPLCISEGGSQIPGVFCCEGSSYDTANICRKDTCSITTQIYCAFINEKCVGTANGGECRPKTYPDQTSKVSESTSSDLVPSPFSNCKLPNICAPDFISLQNYSLTLGYCGSSTNVSCYKPDSKPDEITKPSESDIVLLTPKESPTKITIDSDRINWEETTLIANLSESVAISIMNCQKQNINSGNALRTCFCNQVEGGCEGNQTATKIADYLSDYSAPPSQGGNNLQCLEFVCSIAQGASNSICGYDDVKTVNKLLTKIDDQNRISGYNVCNVTKDFQFDPSDIVVMPDAAAEGHIGTCSNSETSAVCNMVEANTFAPGQVDIRPISNQVTGIKVFRVGACD